MAAHAAVAVIAAAGSGSAWAQATPEDPTLRELLEMVRARDATIEDLRRRVEELEQRSGVPPSAPPVPAAGPEPQAPTEQVEAAEEAAAPAPGEFAVDEEAVDRALERALVQTGALLLPPGAIEVESSFTYTRRETDGPAFLVDDGRQLLAENETRQNELEAEQILRLGLPFDSQLQVAVPYRYEDVSSTATSVDFAERQEVDRVAAGAGDLRVSFAKGLLRERGAWPDLIGRVTWDSDTGQTDNGIQLGSGFHEITGSLTAVKRQDPLVFVGSVSYTTSLEDDGIDPGEEIGVSLGTVLAASPETSLRFFLSQSFTGELEVDGEHINGTDEVSTSLFIGASSIIAPRLLLDVTAGIGLTEDAPDYSINVSLPIRFDLPVRFF